MIMLKNVLNIRLRKVDPSDLDPIELAMTRLSDAQAKLESAATNLVNIAFELVEVIDANQGSQITYDQRLLLIAQTILENNASKDIVSYPRQQG